MAADRKLLQHALRKRRTSLSTTTLLASSASRRGAFAAAMQQFEELMSASVAVGAATRPITLYYATVQAGLAIVAAHQPDPWSFNRHGLKLDNSRQSIAEIGIGPEGTGAFQIVSQASGSPPLLGSVTLAALWATLPDFMDLPLPGSTAPRALGIYEDHDSPLWFTVTVGTGVIDEPPSAMRSAPGRDSFVAGHRGRRTSWR